MLTKEQLQNLISKAVAKAARAEASRPNPKFAFDVLTRKLTFEKSWVIEGFRVRFEINVSPLLELVGEFVYVCIVVEQKKPNECVRDIFDRLIDEYVAKELKEVLVPVAAGPPAETVAPSSAINSSVL